ncbi:MAG: glycosyltransferase, partial [Phycisphaerales bacterium]|nr:glycosyltransferase [Phycisphaerales bacterium]
MGLDTTFEVVVPVYNEGDMIWRVLSELTAFAADNPGFRFLFVDDGSTDDTADQIENYCADNSTLPISLLRLEANRGKGAAVHEGIAR